MSHEKDSPKVATYNYVGPDIVMEESVSDQAKMNKSGIVLIPQPSNDSRDPLNWSASKKSTTLAVISLSAFAGTVQALANGAAYVPQAELYHKTPTQLTYSISAAVAGLAVGPFIWTPLAVRFGKCAVLFWSLICMIAINIWSACMTNPDDYVAFVVSRMFGGITGSAPTTIGSKIIVDIFFLHDRGKCFGIYQCWLLLGTVAAATFSGFIVQNNPWPVQFWWNVGFEAALAVTCLLLLDETTWNRDGASESSNLPLGYVQRKLAIYLFAKRSTASQGFGKELKNGFRPFLVLVSPLTIIVGLCQMIWFAWSVAVTTFLAIFLQTPVEFGGYGFTPRANAYFTFSQWVGVFLAQGYVILVNDRLPLAICARFFGGKWKPELRLQPLWFPVLIVYPIFLGVFGACLHYHWHYMILAVCTTGITFSAITTVPVIINYMVESFTPAYANDVAAAMNFWRLILGIAITFFLVPWEAKVGVNLVFLMTALFTLLGFAVIVAIMFVGPKLRRLNLVKAETAEEGVKVVRKDAEHEKGVQH